MKAAMLIAPKTLIIQDAPEPVLGDYDARCDIVASAVCSGTDRHLFLNDPYFKIQFPTIIGHEAIGRVTQCGNKVRNLKPGDLVTRVFNRLPADAGIHLQWGAFSERGIVTDWQAMRDDGRPESEWKACRVHRVLPPSFNPIASTMIITWRETYSFFKRLNLLPDQYVLIIGSGANALAFADHCRNTGVLFQVLGSLDREQLFLKAGAMAYFAYQDPSAYYLIQSSNIRFNAIIDAIGKSDTVNQVINCLADNGAIAIYGLDQFLNYAIDKGRAPEYFTLFSGEEYDEASTHDEIIDFIQKGKLNAWNYLSKDHAYSLEHALDALRATWERKVLKSVILCSK